MTPTASTSNTSHLPTNKSGAKERRKQTPSKHPPFVVKQPQDIAKADIARAINQYLVRSGFPISASSLQQECERRKIPIDHLMRADSNGDDESITAQQNLLQLLLLEQAQNGQSSEADKPDYEIEKNYHELQKDYHKVVNIASELIDCLERLAKGKTIPPQLLSAISERLSSSTHINNNAKSLKKRSRMAESPAENSSSSTQSRSMSPSPSPKTSSSSKRAIIRPDLSARKQQLKKDALRLSREQDHLLDSPPSVRSRLKKADSMGNILVPSDPHTTSHKPVVTSGAVSAGARAKIFAVPSPHSDNNNNNTALVSSKHSANTGAKPPIDDITANGRNVVVQKQSAKPGHSSLIARQRAASRQSTNGAPTSRNSTTMDVNDPSKSIEHPPCPVIQTTQVSSLADCLNYTKISNHLVMNPSARSSALLLQALRQQITRTPSLAVADENIQQFASKDILSLRNRKNSVLATILTQTEPATEPKEELARFLNSIASFRNGRKYLLSIGQGKEMLYQVALALRTKRLTHFAADQSLAALQKLSIRTLVQKELILSGMIEWLLLNYLDPFLYTSVGNASASQKPSNLGMEFGTALLMNLCLNSVVSQSTVIRYKDQLLNLLSHLLTSKNVQLIPYVCGTLYCLLGAHSRFRQAARERDLETILNSQIPKTSSLEVQRQLGVVLAMLKGELEYDRKKKQSDEEDEEEDYLEAEIDSTDSVIPTLTELFGETLLRRKYCSASSVNQLPIDSSAKSLKEVEEESVPGTVPSRRNQNLLVAVPPTRHRRSPQPNKRRAGVNNSVTSSSVPIQQRRKDGDYSGDANQSKKRQAVSGAKAQRQYGQKVGDRAVIGHRQQSFADEPYSPVRMVRFQEAVASFVSKSAKTTSKVNKESMILEESHTPSTQSPSIPAEPTPPISKTKHTNSLINEHTSKLASHLDSPKKRVQKPEKHNPTYNKRDAWKDVDIDEPITLLHDYANQTDLLEESAALAAVEDKMASTRIPDDADAQEYVSIFGSRPKVIRTPDQRQQTNVTGELSYTAAAGSRHLIVSHH
uniref:LisH domain-containing protein n=1 Tax=Ditylenchus dipsaci TaxID=166011 RepID=A0A915ENB4_9BILA